MIAIKVIDVKQLKKNAKWTVFLNEPAVLQKKRNKTESVLPCLIQTDNKLNSQEIIKAWFLNLQV